MHIVTQATIVTFSTRCKFVAVLDTGRADKKNIGTQTNSRSIHDVQRHTVRYPGVKDGSILYPTQRAVNCFLWAHQRDAPRVKNAAIHFPHHPRGLYTLSLGGKAGLESDSTSLDFLPEKGG